MDVMANALKAKYQANKNVFVTCYIHVIDATAKGFRAQVGIYHRGDTVLPTGTKLYIASDEKQAESTDVSTNQIEVYYVTVEGVEIIKGVPVQLCSPICKETRPERRKASRIQTLFPVRMKEFPERFAKVLSGNVDGLALLITSDQVFLHMVLGQHYHLEAAYKEETLKIPIQVVHIHYDWYHHQHRIGAQIIELNKNQRMILNFLLDPNYTISITDNSAVDTEEARIRAE